MAAEALCRANHTDYRGLEPLLFALLWICARQSWRTAYAGLEKSPNKSRLRKREIGSFKYIAATKSGNRTEDCLEGIMGELPKPLNALQPRCLRISSRRSGDTVRTGWESPRKI